LFNIGLRHNFICYNRFIKRWWNLLNRKMLFKLLISSRLFNLLKRSRLFNFLLLNFFYNGILSIIDLFDLFLFFN
jgi:hypothetical protein